MFLRVWGPVSLLIFERVYGFFRNLRFALTRFCFLPARSRGRAAGAAAVYKAKAGAACSEHGGKFAENMICEGELLL